MKTPNLDDEHQLQSALAEATKAFRSPKELKEAIRETLSTKVNHLARDGRGQSRWKKYRNPAAVALAASVALFFLLGRGEVRLTTVTYAEVAKVIENSDQTEWIHFFNGDHEHWLSYRPFRLYIKSPNAAFACDRSTNRQYDYDGRQKTLTVRYMHRPSTYEMYGSFAEFIRSKLVSWQAKGKQVKKGTETFGGKSVTVYVMSGFREGTLKYFVDTQTDRVVGWERVPNAEFKELVKSRLHPSELRMIIDYPAEGPQSVYALGVSRDVRMIDKTPSPTVLDVVRKVEKAAAAGPPQVYRVAAEVYDLFSEDHPPNLGITMEVTHYKEGRLRRERYCEPRADGHRQSLAHLRGFQQEVVDGGLESVKGWLKERKPEQIMLADVRSGQLTAFHLDADGKLVSRAYSSEFVVQARVWMPWRLPIALDGEPMLLDGHEGRWGKLVGIENRGGQYRSERWLFNPIRDYLCEKHEVVLSADNVDATEVLEYDKTDGGRWYPKKLRKSIHGGRDVVLMSVFLNENVHVDQLMFDTTRVTAQNLAPPFRPH